MPYAFQYSLVLQLVCSIQKTTVTLFFKQFINYTRKLFSPDAEIMQMLRVLHYALCTHRKMPSLKNTVQLVAARQSPSDLWSSTTSAYLLPRLKTKFGERAFSQAGPSAWNAVPTHIRDVPSPNSFRKLLKTHFFSLAFNVY